MRALYSALINLSYVYLFTAPVLKLFYDRAFQVASPGLWNGLPNDIRNAKTMDVFKSLVKTHLFRKAYACYFFLEFYIFDSV